MNKNDIKRAEGSLTIMFEEPFWIGLFEIIDDDGLHVCKVTFGSEPTLQEVIAFIDGHHHELKYSAPVAVEVKAKSQNPKRLIREAKKSAVPTGIGTKSQQALKVQQEMNKSLKAEKSKEQREEEERLRFEQKQLKKREKRKGH